MLNPVEVTQKSPRAPWNKGKLIGAKPPLRSKHVWSIRTRLQVDGRTRDLAMFNLAIDSKLRGCDVVAIKVEDVAPQRRTHLQGASTTSAFSRLASISLEPKPFRSAGCARGPPRSSQLISSFAPIGASRIAQSLRTWPRSLSGR